MQKIEEIALSKLITEENYLRSVLPFLKDEYFDTVPHQILFNEINEYVTEYNTAPETTALKIEIDKRRDLSAEVVKEIEDFLDNKIDDTQYNDEWLMDTTEKWCKERAIYLALMESIKIADGQDKTRTKDAIPHIMSEALGTCFDDTVGHDYLLDADDRYDFYHKQEDKIPFDLEYFNKITKGGLPAKTLNIALAGTGVGKSLFMCHMASACLMQGRNVLYITLEMAEEKIAERIDSNLLDVPIKQLSDPMFTKQQFRNKVDKVNSKTKGRLVIKEYPTASAHVNHFKSLLNELSMKRGFAPDIIFIDYLNICASARYKNAVVNSYTFIKSIAEELRGLAVECNVPIVSATQTTRSGYGNSDVEITDTSESFGLPATADLMVALISTEDMEAAGQIMVKQLKNRYNDPTMNKRFVIGIDRAKMRLYDCDQSAQDNIIDSGQDIDDNIIETKSTSKFDSWQV
jgi:replicative DNA helicase